MSFFFFFSLFIFSLFLMTHCIFYFYWIIFYQLSCIEFYLYFVLLFVVLLQCLLLCDSYIHWQLNLFSTLFFHWVWDWISISCNMAFLFTIFPFYKTWWSIWIFIRCVSWRRNKWSFELWGKRSRNLNFIAMQKRGSMSGIV